MYVIAVDDDHAGRELLRMVLEAAGHGVATRAGLAEALELVAVAVPTGTVLTDTVPTDPGPVIVVTDLVMGRAGDDGYRLIERLRSDRRFDAVGVVALTGVTSRDDLARARAAGADACLPKPIDIARFLDVLEQVRVARVSGSAID